MSDGNQRSSSTESSEVSHRKSLKESKSDYSTETAPVLIENANGEGSKREQASLGRREPSLKSLPGASPTREATVDAAPDTEELTNKHDAQENPPHEPHKASVEA